MAEQDELDAVKIRRVAGERRAAYRTRSYCVIAAFACAVVTIQLGWMMIGGIRASGISCWAVGYTIFACISFYAGLKLAARAAALHREIRQSLQNDEPPTPPDFSSLGDGSTRWKNLEHVE